MVESSGSATAGAKVSTALPEGYEDWPEEQKREYVRALIAAVASQRKPL